MNELIVRFPHLMIKIIKKMDNKGLVKSRKVTRTWQRFIDKGNYPWLRIVKIPTILKNTYLYLAADYGQIDMCEMILQTEGDENLFHNRVLGYSVPFPYLIACHNGHVKIAEMLLMKLHELKIYFCRKANDSIVLDQSESPQIGPLLKIMWLEKGFATACLSGHINVVKMIIDKSVPLELDLADQSGFGHTGFHLACQGGNTNVVELLLDKSESVNFDLAAKDRHGHTGFQKAMNVNVINLIKSKMPCLVVEKPPGLKDHLDRLLVKK